MSDSDSPNQPAVRTDLPDLYSYEGDLHGRHKYSICVENAEDHECYATAYGKTEELAMLRAQEIVSALRAASAGVPAPQSQPVPNWIHGLCWRCGFPKMNLVHQQGMLKADDPTWHEYVPIAAVSVPAPRPQIVKHRSGCKAWTADRAQRWQEGDQATCNCGAWRNWLEQDPAEVGVPAPPSTQDNEPLGHLAKQMLNEAHRVLDTLGAPTTKWAPRLRGDLTQKQEITLSVAERIKELRAAAGVPARRAPQQEPTP